MVGTIFAFDGGLPAPLVTYLNVFVITAVFSLIQYSLIERWTLLQLEDAKPRRSTASLPPKSEVKLPPTVGMLRRSPDGKMAARYKKFRLQLSREADCDLSQIPED